MGLRERMGWMALALFAVVATTGWANAAGGEGAASRAIVVLSRARTTASPAPEQTSPAPVRTAAAETAAPRRTPAPTPYVAPTLKPFAFVAGIPLLHPSDHVHRVGFHQASDVRNLELSVSGRAIRGLVLPTRHRPTGKKSAADIVVRPNTTVRSPVNGIVKRAGTYNLYCKYPDAFVVISPEGHPELEIKMLHVTNLSVKPGDRVVAGKTAVAGKSTKFPFSSQVDGFTGGLRWPHIHLEVTQLEVPSAAPQPGTGLAFGC